MASEIKVVLRQVSASTSEATIGKHQLLVDRPVSKGGSDLGPMGGELWEQAVYELSEGAKVKDLLRVL